MLLGSPDVRLAKPAAPCEPFNARRAKSARARLETGTFAYVIGNPIRL
jgi:hypothetical protein